jgi:hypothetical protein
MVEPTQTSRRWNAFVCPDCRHVFRVPGDYDGRGTVCPACRRMLRLPEADEDTPPLVLPLRRKKRASSQRHREEKQERVFDETFADKESTSPVLVKIIVAAAISTVILIAAGLLWPRGETETAQTPGEPRAATPDPAAPVDPGDSEASETAADDEPSEPVDVPLRASMVAAELAPVVEHFLTAESLDEARALVRHPDVTGPRMEEFHNGEYRPPGFRKMTEGARGDHVLRDGRWARAVAVSEDFSQQVFWLAKDAGGQWKIDWESWAGWSPWTWKEIREGKPEGPFELRVRLNNVAYYNFDFADESRWSSYSLRGPHDERPLYGYARRGSPADIRLGLHEKQRDRPFRVRVRKPENAANPNQLRIEKVLSEGWLDPGDSP